MPGTPSERDSERSPSRRASRGASALRAAADRVVGRRSKPVAAAAKSASADVTASAKKAGAKKAAAKKTGAKKAAAKKTAAKKTAAKKTAAKKTAAKKAGAKKAGAKKTGAKKAGAKKTGAKKTGAKKSGAKKAGSRQVAASPTVPRRGGLPVLAGEDPWTKAEIAEVRGELDEERQRLLGEVAAAEQEIKVLLRDGGDGAGNDQADIGSKALERDAEMSLANNSREMLFQVERAMTRLEDGSYGLCESCGQPIGKLRLMAFPRATLCMTCKQRQERR